MTLSHLKRAMRGLTIEQLRKLDGWLHELIGAAEEDEREEPPSRRQIVEERSDGDKTYRLESVRCGKAKCRCAAGKLHGPYWYSYMRVGGRLKSQYVGKKLPPDVERRLLKARSR